MKKSKPAIKYLLDARIVLTSSRDKALAQYIKEQAVINRRKPNAQIIHMLTFAAAQMSGHDMEKETVQ